MAKECLSNSAESQVPATPPENPEREPVKIMVVGSRWAVLLIIHTLHRLGFAPAGEWSKLQVEPATRQWMSVLTKWLRR
ncbi:hypothetical protein HNI00_10815 [Thermoleptolyngbya oregonensis NK1-22]|uniref:Uncharacterized protein n=1 Tax=Thermoleptolyngbya oregonensis NK1-22 TaxID=2547457 RepID=A0AA96Y491_9CYAN|nr:hypothetical protein [Thermoleptolyngbya oregonensis]WOB43590.1 hypothetical protein HNI00_10815 [Thermoleptolyngbya oregonensis NK1-22]